MRIVFFGLLVCVLVVFSNVSAQEARDREKFEQQEYPQDWSEIETATSRLFVNKLDRNFYVLPSGNVEYWKSTSYRGSITVSLFEVNCLERQNRLLKSTRNTPAGRVTEGIGSWYSIDGSSSNSQVGAVVCRLAKPPVVEKKIVRRKVVKKVRKGNQ